MGARRQRVSFHFTHTGRLPGLNEILDAKRRVHRRNAGDSYADLKRKIQSSLVAEIRIRKASTRRPIFPLSRCRVSITWAEPNRRRDPDNVAAGAKFLFDALVAAGILANDGWDDVAAICHQFEIAKSEPFVSVWIDGFPPGQNGPPRAAG